MCLEKWSTDDGGFSLIEVILAVAILALMTLPILNYFTNSSLRTIDGRDKQTATMAAENVMEELSIFSNYEQIRELTATPDPAAPTQSAESGWRTSEPESGEAEDPKSDYIEKKLTLNGFDFLAKVRINYGVYHSGTKTINDSAGEEIGSGTGDVIRSEFNDYKIPNPSEVYSESNVVASENDEIDTALSEIYTTVQAAGAGSVTYKNIRDNMSRTICVDVSYLSDKEYSIRVYYLYSYSYNGSTYQAEVTLENKAVEKSKFKRVFVFYDPLRPGQIQDPVRVRTGSEVSGSKQIPTSEGDRASEETGTVVKDMEFYFAVQITKPEVLATKPADYKISVDCVNALNAKFFTNVGDIMGVTSNESGTNDFVERKSKERIGRIFVDIYELAPNGRRWGDKPVAHMETTMAE